MSDETPVPSVETPVVEAADVPLSEPAPPFWAARPYIRRSFGRQVNGVFIQGSFYQAAGKLDIDGLYGDADYESTDQLIKLAGWSHEQVNEFVTWIHKLLQSFPR